MRGLAIALTVLACACGGSPPATSPRAPGAAAADVLPDVRVAKDRPPVVLVSREGDPAGAIAAAVVTSDESDDAERAVALAGVVEARLLARGHAALVTPAWDGFRAVVLLDTPQAARAATEALRDALLAPIGERDLAAAKKKLAALALRPLRDEALGRWARCVGTPFAAPEHAGKPYDDLAIARLESWRAAAHVLGRTAFAVAATRAVGEEVAAAIARGPAWKKGTPPPASHAAANMEAEVFDAPGETSPVVYATLDVGSSSAAAFAAEALGDPRGALATRLAALDVPFRVREVTGTAHASGGCVGVVLEAPSGAAGTADLAARVADAVAVVRVETDVVLSDATSARDGRTLAWRAGDARRAAEGAAWWALTPADPRGKAAKAPASGSVALATPAPRGAPPTEKTKDKTDDDERAEPQKRALASAIEHALVAWKTPIVEARARIERGQGEAWILVASPCGTDAESEGDAGLTALFVTAAAEAAKSSPEARVEPWIVPDGAGLLVHGPALAGEAPAAHVRRLADVVARSFAVEPLAPTALSRARATLLRHDAAGGGPAFDTLAATLSPQHPSWVLASGRDEVLVRSADAAVVARAQALRKSGPLRVAVLANVDEAEADAAQRAVDRWVDRHGGEARSCKVAPAGAPPRPGTYAAAPRPGAAPEAYLAFPFPAGDEGARAAAELVAAALGTDGDGGLLDKALGGSAALARSASARVLGWPRSPALVVRIVSSQAELDDAVMQTRALFDRLRRGGLAAGDLERARATAARGRIVAALDPRARVVATWRGEPVPPAAPRVRVSDEDARGFVQKHLVEDAMIVVAARPSRKVTP